MSRFFNYLNLRDPINKISVKDNNHVCYLAQSINGMYFVCLTTYSLFLPKITATRHVPATFCLVGARVFLGGKNNWGQLLMFMGYTSALFVRINFVHECY